MWHHKQTSIRHSKQDICLKPKAGSSLKGTGEQWSPDWLQERMGGSVLTAFALRIRYHKKSGFLIRESTFRRVTSIYNDAPQRWEQDEKGQQNTGVCSEDRFALKDSPTVHASKDHEQREGAEVSSVGGDPQQGRPAPVAERCPGGKTYGSQDLLWLSDELCGHTGLFWSLFSNRSTKCLGVYCGRITSSFASLTLSTYQWGFNVAGETLILPFLRKQLTSFEVGTWGNPGWTLRLCSWW